MGLFNADKSSRTTNTTNNQYNDNRSVVDASGGGVVGSGNIITYESGDDVAAEMFKVGAQNSATAWSNTIDASEALIGKLIDSTDKTNNTAQAIAGAAIASFQPTDNKNADALKWALMAGVAVLALAFFRK